jgi:hypothetical protein
VGSAQLFHQSQPSRISGESWGKDNEPLFFSGNVAKDLCKSWTKATKTLLRGTKIWFKELPKFPGTFKWQLLLKTWSLATQCLYSLFQVEIEDDPLEISITRSPVKSRPRLDDDDINFGAENDVSNDFKEFFAWKLIFMMVFLRHFAHTADPKTISLDNHII